MSEAKSINRPYGGELNSGLADDRLKKEMQIEDEELDLVDSPLGSEDLIDGPDRISLPTDAKGELLDNMEELQETLEVTRLEEDEAPIS